MEPKEPADDVAEMLEKPPVTAWSEISIMRFSTLLSTSMASRRLVGGLGEAHVADLS